MKSSGGFERYNTQPLLMIVATGVTNNAADNSDDRCGPRVSTLPSVVADAGYKSEENFEG